MYSAGDFCSDRGMSLEAQMGNLHILGDVTLGLGAEAVDLFA